MDPSDPTGQHYNGKRCQKWGEDRKHDAGNRSIRFYHSDLSVTMFTHIAENPVVEEHVVQPSINEKESKLATAWNSLWKSQTGSNTVVTQSATPEKSTRKITAKYKLYGRMQTTVPNPMGTYGTLP